MVRCSVRNASSLDWRPFFCGRKPSKQNLSQGSPLLTRAGTKAVAPGRVYTSMPALMASRTTRNPGSLIPGVPASDTTATVSPASSRSTTLLTV